jgi:hypothetical protein
VATGEVAERTQVDPSSLAVGEVITNSGRISVAKMYEPHAPALPFTPGQLASLDEALTLASRETGLDFSDRPARLALRADRGVARPARRGDRHRRRSAPSHPGPRRQAGGHEHGRVLQGGRPRRWPSRRPPHAYGPGRLRPPHLTRTPHKKAAPNTGAAFFASPALGHRESNAQAPRVERSGTPGTGAVRPLRNVSREAGAVDQSWLVGEPDGARAGDTSWRGHSDQGFGGRRHCRPSS